MKVYIVENIETGKIINGYSKGTKVYTKEHNAVNLLFHQYRAGRGNHVVEYELVPTGRVITKEDIKNGS